MDLHDCQSMLEKAEDEIDRLRKSYADILKRQTDKFLNEKKENDRLRNLYKETCEEKNKEIFEWIEHSKQLVLISQQWQDENAQLREALLKAADTNNTTPPFNSYVDKVIQEALANKKS